MTQEIVVFEKEYDGESIIDMSQDVGECILSEYNPIVSQIPSDEYGIQLGKFVVSVVWKPEE